MDAGNINLLKFVKDASQFVIPIYQRKYSWERQHCKQLWDDIMRAGENKSPGGHFIGSIVYVADNAAFNTPFLVIDGQQRLTTLTLLIVALSEAIGEQEPLDGFDRKRLKNYYLINPDEKGEKSRRLVLSETDRDTLFAIIGGHDLPVNFSHRIDDNFKFFKERIVARKSDLSVVCRGLSKLLVVHIALSPEQDNPQLVFESMNSKGLELSQADLIRNYMLMGLEIDEQERLYNVYWRPMEQTFGQENYKHHFDRFMRHYLTVKTGKIPRLKEVYVAFKNFARDEKQDMENLVQDVHRFSRFYCAMALEQETDADLKTAFCDLNGLQVNVAYPLLLALYSDYDGELLSQRDFLKAVQLIESYIFRRAVCGIPTQSLNKTFEAFGKSLEKERYLGSIMEHFLSLKSYRRFPSNDEFKESIKQRDLYNFGIRNYWIRRIENFEGKERVPIDDYTIEHIMPQTLTDEWKKSLGEGWKRTYEKYLHTLGNLTLTGYNPEYSNKSFKDKRDMKGGFRRSPLRMNDELRERNEWSEQAIEERADKLAEKAIQIWIYPEGKPNGSD